MKEKAQRPDRVMLSMPRELILEARAKAIREGSNLSAVVRKLLREWMEEDPPKEDEDA